MIRVSFIYNPRSFLSIEHCCSHKDRKLSLFKNKKERKREREREKQEEEREKEGKRKRKKEREIKRENKIEGIV